MNHSIISKLAFINLLFLVFLSGCNLYNLDIPEYIDTYTNTAAGGRHEFNTTVLEGRSADIHGNYWIILPGEETKITVFLRNPKNYRLLPIIETYTGIWENLGEANDTTHITDITGINGNTVRITAEHGPDRKDMVTIHIGLTGEGNYPEVGDEFRLKLRLKDLGSGRDPFEETYELPLLRCNEYPAAPENMKIGEIVPETGKEYDYGMEMTWKQTEQNDFRGPDKMVISAGDKLVPETFTRTLDPLDFTWSDWSDGNGNTIPSGSDYSYHAFQGQETYSDQVYTVTLSFTNRDGLPSTGTFTYDGIGSTFYVDNDGGWTGSSSVTPTTLADALLRISNSSVIYNATIIVLENLYNIEPLTIETDTTITLTSEDTYSINLGTDKTGSLFTLESDSALIIKPVSGKSLELKNSNSSNDTALITIGTGANLELQNGAAISGNNNTSGSGGGVYVSGGILTMENGSRIYSNSAASGGGVYVNGGTFTMENGSRIYSNSAANGGGIYMNGGIFTMNSGTIGGSLDAEKNSASSRGGGVYLNGGEFAMPGGSISYNSAANGGGVYTTGNTTQFTITGGMIQNNSTSANGGGIYAAAGAKVNFVSGNIGGSSSTYKNTALNDGGGVYVTGSGTQFTLEGGAIQNNSASANGGGIYAAAEAKVKLVSGNIGGSSSTYKNTAGTSGGGVYLTGANTKFEMSGGYLRYNTAGTNGGGVCIMNNAEFIKSAGDYNTFTGNSLTGSGYGKGVYADSTITMGGAAAISTGNDIYLTGTGTGIKKLNIASDLTASTAGVITVESSNYGTRPVVLSGQIRSANAASNLKFNVTPNPSGTTWRINSLGKLIQLTTTLTVGPGDRDFPKLDEAINEGLQYEYFYVSKSAVIKLAAGTQVVDETMTVTGGRTIQIISEGTTTITRGASQNGIMFNFTNRTTTLGAESGGGTIIIDGDGRGQAVANGYSAAIRVDYSDSNLVMYDGVTIRNMKFCTPVYIEGGTFTMHGGSITGNKLGYDAGGVRVTLGTTFIMNGGTIANNSAKGDGGGVTISDTGSLFIMNGGSIENNEAAAGDIQRNGGGVYMYAGAVMKFYGGIIKGNKMADGARFKFGRGIYLVNGTGKPSGNTKLYIKESALAYCEGTDTGTMANIDDIYVAHSTSSGVLYYGTIYVENTLNPNANIHSSNSPKATYTACISVSSNILANVPAIPIFTLYEGNTSIITIADKAKLKIIKQTGETTGTLHNGSAVITNDGKIQ